MKPLEIAVFSMTIIVVAVVIMLFQGPPWFAVAFGIYCGIKTL